MSVLLLGLFACATVAETTAAVASPLLSIDRAVDRTPFEGTVAERIEAGGYVYLRVDERWVVGFDHGLAVGDRARSTPIGLARDFHSKRTGRTFAELWFAVTEPPGP